MNESYTSKEDPQDVEKPVGDMESTGEEEKVPYDKDKDPVYWRVQSDFFRTNALEKEPLFDQIMAVVSQGDPEEISIFHREYANVLSDEARTYLGTEYTVRSIELRNQARAGLSNEEKAVDEGTIGDWSERRTELAQDPAYQKVAQEYFASSNNVERESDLNNELLYITQFNSYERAEEFLNTHTGELSLEAVNYLRGYMWLSKKLESEGFESPE
jgi:hypothetical protein